MAAGSSIHPASKEQVPFSENTVYTVTAEDGTTQAYTLKLILNIPVPTVSLFKTTNPTVSWGHAVSFAYLSMTIRSKKGNYVFMGDLQTDENVNMLSPVGKANEVISYPLEEVVEKHKVSIEGEYFISGQGSSGDFRVFIRRLKDGFEIETPIETLTENKIVSVFPDYTSVLDTGKHKLFLQINGREFEGPQIHINAPSPAYLKGDFKFHQQGQLVKGGDEIKLTYDNIHDDYDGTVTRFYKLDQLKSIEYIFAQDVGSNIARGQILRKDLIIEGNTITHKLPDGMVSTNNNGSMKLRSISLVFPFTDQRGRNGFVTGNKIFPMPEGALVTHR